MYATTAVLFGLVAMAAAYPLPWWGWPYSGYPGFGGYYGHAYPYYWGAPAYPGYHGYHGGLSKLTFYGKFKGACDAAHDGLYYVDDYNFAFCTGGKKVVQKCAEGSANPPLDYFKDGNYYGFYDFCSVNLIANGYNAQPYPAPAKPHRDTYVPEDSYAPEGYLETTHQETEYYKQH